MHNGKMVAYSESPTWARNHVEWAVTNGSDYVKYEWMNGKYMHRMPSFSKNKKGNTIESHTLRWTGWEVIEVEELA